MWKFVCVWSEKKFDFDFDMLFIWRVFTPLLVYRRLFLLHLRPLSKGETLKAFVRMF